MGDSFQSTAGLAFDKNSCKNKTVQWKQHKGRIKSSRKNEKTAEKKEEARRTVGTSDETKDTAIREENGNGFQGWKELTARNEKIIEAD